MTSFNDSPAQEKPQFRVPNCHVVSLDKVPQHKSVAAFLRRGTFIRGVSIPKDVAGVNEIWVKDKQAKHALEAAGFQEDIVVLGELMIWDLN